MCLNSNQPKLCSTVLNERTFDERARFGDVFELLLETRTLTTLQSNHHQATVQNNPIATALQKRLQSQTDDLQSLPKHKQYSRHVIGTDGDWMGFICRWEPHVCSCTHGHPSFAYYQVIEGEFLMDLYEVTAEHKAELTTTERMVNGDCIWQEGQSGRYDNLVHKVHSTGSAGFTLHLFSENPALGQHF